MKSNNDSNVEMIGETIEYVKQYSLRQINLVKLELAQRVAKLLSRLATSLILALIILLVLLFTSITIAFALSSWLVSYVAGFSIVTFAYISIGFLIIYFKRQFVTNPILEMVIKEMFDENG